jgi:hypothetical protein
MESQLLSSSTHTGRSSDRIVLRFRRHSGFTAIGRASGRGFLDREWLLPAGTAMSNTAIIQLYSKKSQLHLFTLPLIEEEPSLMKSWIIIRTLEDIWRSPLR